MEAENIKIKVELDKKIYIDDLTTDIANKMIDNIGDYIRCGYSPEDNNIIIEDEVYRDLMRKIIIRLYEKFI